MLLHRKSTSSIPTHFQCSTETDSFHPKAVLPIKNVPDAAYNNTTTTTKPTVGRALQGSPIPDRLWATPMLFGNHPAVTTGSAVCKALQGK